MEIKWVDRVATHPGRVQLTPVVGQTNIYDMERADEPTVVGTPVNAANLNAMQQNVGLGANKTVYVAMSGSDSTGDGSSTSPYQTITKALSTIPKQLNGYSATVHIGAGTYTEDVSVSGFSNGMVYFYSTSGNNVEISRLEISNTAHFQTSNGINLKVNNGIVVTNNSFAYIESIVTCGDVARGIQVAKGSKVVFTNTVEINNTTEFAIFVTNANLVIATMSGTNNNTGVRVTSAGMFSYVVNNLTATVVYSTTSGGRIYAGAQTSIPNY